MLLMKLMISGEYINVLINENENLIASIAKVISVLEFDHDLQHLCYESCKH